MTVKDDLLQLVRRIRGDLDEIASKADDIEDDPDGAGDEIRALADDALAKLTRLRSAIETIR